MGICGSEEAPAEDRDARAFPMGNGVKGNFRAFRTLRIQGGGSMCLICTIEPLLH